MKTKRIILAISGASGSFYAKAALQALIHSGAFVNLVASPTAKQIWNDEMDQGSLDNFIKELPQEAQARISFENCKIQQKLNIN